MLAKSIHKAGRDSIRPVGSISERLPTKASRSRWDACGAAPIGAALSRERAEV